MTTENKNMSVPSEQVSTPEAAEDMKKTTPVDKTPKEESAPTELAATETAPQSESVEETLPSVDFSDEEADLAGSAPEFDLGEEGDALEEETSDLGKESKSTDYSGMNKEELLAALEELLATRPVQSIRQDAEAIKVAFYKLYRGEVEQLRRLFVEAGGLLEEFVPPTDPAEQRLKELFGEYRTKRNEYIARIEEQKEENYKHKLRIIDELKELINSNETLNSTFSAFRDLQNRWKEIGVVQQTHVKDLWETYNLHVENFYNFIKINKELRDLDLKKNYEAKLQLCEEAEALLLEPSVITAFHKLQKLHDQWRETGPVANEYKEQLWERFREASSKINKQHQEHFEGLKEEQKKNLELKVELCLKAEELAAAPFSTRKEWDKGSDRLIDIQKVWKTIGFAPKKDNTKIYERFRNACDRFFENKRNYYLQVKVEMEHNLELKNEICAAAEALKESEEWKKATDELIALQKKWKEVGAVSRRHSDAVWKRFRSACDHFFERKANYFSSVEELYQDNLKKKEELLVELKAFAVEEREKGFEALKELQRRWSEIGFVPIKQKEAIQTEYRKAVDAIFATLRGQGREDRMERFKSKISNLVEGGSDRRMRHERERLYNKLKQMEADIALLENNIGFFSKSKNAESMIKDVNEKIDRLKREMGTIVEQIQMIDNQQAE